MQTIFSELLYSVQFIATLAALFFFHRFGLFPETRRDVVLWGALWIAAATVSYWIFGPYSFNAIQTELDFAVPIHQYYANLPAGTKFAHEFAGGVDAYAINQFTGQYLSLERFLVSAMPTWLGIAIHKVMLHALGFAGAYILCRRFGKCTRAAAFGAAMIASMAGDAVTIQSYWHGLAIGALPLAIYLFIVRFGRPHYYKGVIVFSAFYAVTSTFPVTLLSIFIILPLAAFALGSARRTLQVVPALCILFGFVILNWHETIYAMAQIAPLTMRGTPVFSTPADVNLAEVFLGIYRTVHHASNLMALTAVVSAGVMFWRVYRPGTRGLCLRLTAVVGAFGLLLFILTVFPWGAVGLDIVGAMSFHYAALGLPSLILLLVAAAGATALTEGPRRLAPRFFAVILIALAVGKLAYYKTYEALIWASSGGLSSYRLESLEQPSWKKGAPFRVANVPYRLADNALPAMGLDAATGIFSLQIAATVPYWDAVNTRFSDTAQTSTSTVSPLYSTGPSLYSRLSESVAKCCLEYDIVEFGVNPDLLRVANVRFITSRLPLTGGGLRKVAGPPDGTILPRDSTPYKERIGPYLRWIIDPPPPYVYELPDPTPRLYAAQRIVTVPDGISMAAFYKLVTQEALSGGAILRAEDASRLSSLETGLIIERYAVVKNGFDVYLKPGNGGVFIVNVTHVPFWKAFAGEIALTVGPANGIHTAVAVPKGVRRVSVRYQRLLLREKIASYFSSRP